MIRRFYLSAVFFGLLASCHASQFYVFPSDTLSYTSKFQANSALSELNALSEKENINTDIIPSDVFLHVLGFETRSTSLSFDADTDIFNRPNVVVLFKFDVDDADTMFNLPLNLPISTKNDYYNFHQVERMTNYLNGRFGGDSLIEINYNVLKTGSCDSDEGTETGMNVLVNHFEELMKKRREKPGRGPLVILYDFENLDDVIEDEVSGEINALLGCLERNCGKSRYVAGILAGRGQQKKVSQRHLEDTNIFTVTEEELFNFLAIIWTCLSLALFLFVILCCFDWDSERDPVLYTSFKDENSAK